MDSRRASANPRAGDPESFCSQEVSIKIQGAYHYLRHPQQDIYLAAIYGRDVSFCGDPAKAPWEALNGFTTISARMLSQVGQFSARSGQIRSPKVGVEGRFGTHSWAVSRRAGRSSRNAGRWQKRLLAEAISSLAQPRPRSALLLPAAFRCEGVTHSDGK